MEDGTKMLNQHILWGNAPHSFQDKCLMNDSEVIFLRQIVTGKKVIEIGCFRGGSSKVIAAVAEKLLCIDPFEPLHWSDKEGEHTVDDFEDDFQAAIMPFDNVSVIKTTSDKAVWLKDRLGFTADVVLIDGDHTYEQCTRDLEHYRAKEILVHDYALMFPGVIAACTNHFGRHPDKLVGTMAYYYG